MLTDQELAEEYRPTLILYPEISKSERVVRKNWREEFVAPLRQDYWPRDVELALRYSDRHPGGYFDIFGEKISHTDRDGFWRRYHEIDKSQFPVTSYVNIKKYGHYVALQYWFFYVYNDWRATHEGDWENITVFLRVFNSEVTPIPLGCAYSVHHGGQRLSWHEVEKKHGLNPLVYVANGSHANYFFGGETYHNHTEKFGLRLTTGEFPFTGDFIDHTLARNHGVEVEPELVIIPGNAQKWIGKMNWMNFKEDWGAPGTPPWMRFLPKSLRFKISKHIWGAPAALRERDNFWNPFKWANEQCEDAMPHDNWLKRLE